MQIDYDNAEPLKFAISEDLLYIIFSSYFNSTWHHDRDGHEHYDRDNNDHDHGDDRELWNIKKSVFRSGNDQFDTLTDSSWAVILKMIQFNPLISRVRTTLLSACLLSKYELSVRQKSERWSWWRSWVLAKWSSIEVSVKLFSVHSWTGKLNARLTKAR